METGKRPSGRTWRPSSGLLILQIVSLVPFVGAIASLFGFGAVLLLAWRVFRQPTPASPIVGAGTPQPMGI